MVVIVAGGGALGEGVARALAREDHDVVVIERDVARVEDLRGHGLRVIVGNATSPGILEAAGALHAGVVIVCVSRDEDALVIAALARRHFQIARVVVVVREEEHRWLFDEGWGVDVAISSASVFATLIESAVSATSSLRASHLVDDHFALIEVGIDAHSPARGVDVSALSLPAGDVVACVVRDGTVVPLSSEVRLAVGDLVLVVATTGDEALVRRAFDVAGEHTTP
jgi:trk system potassium uptake protein